MKRNIRLRTSILSRVAEYITGFYRVRLMRLRIWMASCKKLPF